MVVGYFSLISTIKGLMNPWAVGRVPGMELLREQRNKVYLLFHKPKIQVVLLKIIPKNTDIVE